MQITRNSLATAAGPSDWVHPARSTSTRFMAHIAMLDVDDEGNSATWGDHVGDDEYGAAPAIDA
jgi:hypothetical protein